MDEADILDAWIDQQIKAHLTASSDASLDRGENETATETNNDNTSKKKKKSPPHPTPTPDQSSSNNSKKKKRKKSHVKPMDEAQKQEHAMWVQEQILKLDAGSKDAEKRYQQEIKNTIKKFNSSW